MRSVPHLLVVVAALAVAAMLDLANDYTRGFGLGPPSATVRILLAAAINLAFAGMNIAVASVCIRNGVPSRLVSGILISLGAVAILYFPLWSMGLPSLAPILSRRWNPLSTVFVRGGLHSFFNLETAGVLLLGITSALRRRPQQPQP